MDSILVCVKVVGQHFSLCKSGWTVGQSEIHNVKGGANLSELHLLLSSLSASNSPSPSWLNVEHGENEREENAFRAHFTALSMLSPRDWNASLTLQRALDSFLG